MATENKSKRTLKIVLITLLSLVLVTGVILAVVFGLRAAWRREVVENLEVPSAEQGITVNMHEYGFTNGAKSSYEYVLKYAPSREGLWLYASVNRGYIFVYDDIAYSGYVNQGTAYVSETFGIDSLDDRLSTFEVTELLGEFNDLIFNNRDEAVKKVRKRGNNYIATLDGDYLTDNHFNGTGIDPGINDDISYGDFACEITAPEGSVQALKLSYNYVRTEYWYSTGHYHKYYGERRIDMEIEQSADFSDVVMPEAFLLAQSRKEGNLLKSFVSYSDKYADTAYITPDGAVTIYTDEYEGAVEETVSVYAEEKLLTVTNDYRVELYALPSLKKLCTFEYYAEIAGSDVADGRLAVMVNGRPDTGEYEIDKTLPVLSYVYIYDLDTFGEAERYNISNSVSEEVGGVVYDGEDVFFVDGEGKKMLDSSAGAVKLTDSIPASSAGTDGGGYSFIKYTPEAGEGYIYPDIEYFFVDGYTGYSFGGYDLVKVQCIYASWQKADGFGLFDRAAEKFIYLFPKTETLGYGQEFVCSVGDGKYVCFIERSLFTIDMNKIEPHNYEHYTIGGNI